MIVCLHLAFNFSTVISALFIASLMLDIPPAIMITTIPAPISSLSITITLDAFNKVSKALIVAIYT